MDKDTLKNVVECLLFIADRSLAEEEICEIAGIRDKKKITEAIRSLDKDYKSRNTGLEISEVAKGFRICTKSEYAGWVKKLYRTETTYQVSQSALETLSIIAYKQPITRAEIETIRGVDISGVLRGLLVKKLVKVSGRKKCPGRPLTYRTTDKFLMYFGLKDLSELPRLDEISVKEEGEKE